MITESYKTIKFAKSLKDINSDNPKVKEKAKNYIYDLCKSNGGIFTKMIQYLGNKSDAPIELEGWQKELKEVLDRESILQILRSEWESEPFTYLSKLSEEYYPASIGQVTRATLKQGDPIAIKTQYPQIENSIKEQLKLIGLLPKAGKVSKIKKWGFDFSEYQKMIEGILTQELDYTIEKKKQLEFIKVFKKEIDIKVPVVYEHLCTKKVFTSQYISGDSFDDVCKSYDQKQRLAIGERLIRSLLISLFYKNEIHCDPNPHNFIFTKECLYLIDFGQTYKFDKQFVSALKEIYFALKEEKSSPPLDLFVALGFDRDKLTHIEDFLPTIANILMKPFVSAYAFDLESWNYQEQIKLVLGDSVWWFRSAGGAEFFSLMKTFAGLKEMIKKLGVHIFYHKIVEDILKDPHIEWVKIPQVECKNQTSFKSEAKKIFIRVLRGGKEKVKLSLPIGALLDLPSMLDEDIRLKLESRKLDIDEIIRSSIKDGIKPRTMFELREDGDEFKVWLE